MSTLSHRFATETDLPLLGRLNRHLIEDEGHSNPMDPDQLADRMGEWLRDGSHTVLVFEDAGAVVAYAVFRPEEWGVYLRQLFVTRERRGEGIGRRVMETLEQEHWRGKAAVRLDVLCGNSRAQRFYREIGYRDHCITMAKPLPPAGSPEGAA